MKRAAVAGLVIWSLAGMGSSQAACRVVPFGIFFGSDTSTGMSVSVNEMCAITLRPGTGGTARGNIFESIKIVDRPQHGIVAKGQRYTAILYRPNPGFKGSDSFSFVAIGR